MAAAHSKAYKHRNFRKQIGLDSLDVPAAYVGSYYTLAGEAGAERKGC